MATDGIQGGDRRVHGLFGDAHAVCLEDGGTEPFLEALTVHQMNFAVAINLDDRHASSVGVMMELAMGLRRLEDQVLVAILVAIALGGGQLVEASFAPRGSGNQTGVAGFILLPDGFQGSDNGIFIHGPRIGREAGQSVLDRSVGVGSFLCSIPNGVGGNGQQVGIKVGIHISVPSFYRAGGSRSA